METNTATKLTLIAKKAKDNPQVRFTSLMYLLNPRYLKDCFQMLKRCRAPGVDGRILESYSEQEIAQVIDATVDRMKRKRYRPQPIRRVYLPKPNGDKRPLGIPTVIDKAIQLGCARILEAIFEPAFLPNSFGFRPGRSAHDALKEVNHLIMGQKVNWIIDADIKGFFDQVDHTWMMRCLDQKIADPHFKRLILRFLQSGVMEEGTIRPTSQGTPQGGIVSPILANIYLHFVLDLWFAVEEKRKLKGYAKLVRYADDFLIGVQHKQEAYQLLRDLEARLKKFSLTLSPEKTSIKEFGRFAEENRRKRGQQKPETFDFLGFTHYCTATRDGRFMVRVKTARGRMKKAAVAINQWLKAVRNQLPLEKIWPLIISKLQGHYQYYGVSGNFEGINRFYQTTCTLTFKWMNRRSWGPTWSWQEFWEYLATHPLLRPKLTYAIYNTW